jgi:uncharacterized protein YeeX (DUF496 family)
MTKINVLMRDNIMTKINDQMRDNIKIKIIVQMKSLYCLSVEDFILVIILSLI